LKEVYNILEISKVNKIVGMSTINKVVRDVQIN